MAKLSLLLLCAVLLHTGYALQCYICHTSRNKHCDLADKDKIAVARCGMGFYEDILGYSPACIKKVYADKITNMQNTTRACIILAKTDVKPYECNSDTDRINVIACEICNDDLCNAAAQTHAGIAAAVGSALAFFAMNRLH